MANALRGETRFKNKPWQRMCDATLYDGWEMPHPAVNGRSYLFHLPPIGIGTAAVESLTGYISRLAAAHAVETGVLVNRELLPRIPYTKGSRPGQVPTRLPCSFFLGAHTLNGLGDRPRLWVSLLEELTCIERLDLLTALPWAEMLSCVHLLRFNRAWCPACYGRETPSAQSVYERLLWAFQIVTVCPSHRRPLDSSCPTCGRTQYVFSSKSRPGYCSRCQCWLGREHDAGTIDGDGDPAEEICIAEMVGELLAANSTLPAGFGSELFRENVRSFVHNAGGVLRFRATFQNRHIRGWVRGAEVPRIDSAVALALNQNVSLVRVLTEPAQSRNTDQRSHPYAYVRHRISGSVVEKALQIALGAAIPPPLQEIANQLQYRTVDSLKKRFPVLCGEIVARRRADPNTFRPRATAMPVPRERIEAALREELNKDELTDLPTVAASVGLRSSRRLYKGFHDFRAAIAAKNAAIRSQNPATGKRGVEPIEKALQAAFDERPVPTVAEVARRLGFADARPVAWRFPELAAELRSRQVPRAQTERPQQARQSIREALIGALKEDPPLPCSEIVRRLRGHKTQIRESFPDLWRALRTRYVEHKRDVNRSKREAFAAEVHRAVAELHRKGIHPAPALVLANIPEPQYRSLSFVAETVRRVKLELSGKLGEAPGVMPSHAAQSQALRGLEEVPRGSVSTVSHVPIGAAVGLLRS